MMDGWWDGSGRESKRGVVCENATVLEMRSEIAYGTSLCDQVQHLQPPDHTPGQRSPDLSHRTIIPAESSSLKPSSLPKFLEGLFASRPGGSLRVQTEAC